MRNPHVSIKFMKGGSIHPKYKLLAPAVGSVDNLANHFNKMTMNKGLGIMETKPARISRKPLKFIL